MKKIRFIVNSVTRPLITTAISSGIVLLLTLIAFSESVMQKITESNSPIFYSIVIGVLCIASMVIFLQSAGLLILYHYNQYKREHSYLAKMRKIHSLGKDFSPIVFKHWDSSPLAEFVDEDSVTCMAKLDDKGKIIYQIHVDAEMSTKDYMWFLKNFSIDKS